MPPDASLHGPALDQHLLLNLWIALGFATLAHLLLVTGLLFRRSVAESHLSLNWKVEYVPLTLFAIVFAMLTIRAERLWAATRYTGASPEALQIEVTGAQFAWYFRYPGRDATFGRTLPSLVDVAAANPLGEDQTDPHTQDDVVSSEFVLPVGREADLTLHAQDVIHGFAIPEMRLKQNAIPGETVHLHFTPVRTGRYAILCTQLCGLGHYRMQANLRVVSDNEYAAWLQSRSSLIP